MTLWKADFEIVVVLILSLRWPDSRESIRRFPDPKGPNLEKNQDRLKFSSISLEIFFNLA